MTNVTAMPIHGLIQCFSLCRTDHPMALKLSMQQEVIEYYKDCSTLALVDFDLLYCKVEYGKMLEQKATQTVLQISV